MNNYPKPLLPGACWLYRSLLCIFIILILPSFTHGSTFVGNGGNGMDFELKTVLQAISVGLDRINDDYEDVSTDGGAGDEDESLCVCAEREGRFQVCDTLSQMNKAQVKFCQKTILSTIDQLKNLIDRQKLQYAWSDEPLKVKEEGSDDERPVTALSQFAQKKVIIHQQAFMDLPSSQKVALITHELYHFIEQQGKQGQQQFNDVQSYGPFEGPYGGRALLNNLGAAVALQIYRKRVYVSRESRGYKSHFINMNAGGSTMPFDTSNSLLLKDNTGTSYSIRYTYFFPDTWTHHGLNLSHESSYWSGNGKIISTYLALRTNTVRLGYSHRWFPIRPKLNDQRAISSQTHLVADVFALTGSGQYKISDSYTALSGPTTVSGFGGALNFMFPLSDGNWFNFGLESRSEQLKIPVLSFEQTADITAFHIGASYGN